MVDFKKLMNHTPEEKTLADKEIEKKPSRLSGLYKRRSLCKENEATDG